MSLQNLTEEKIDEMAMIDVATELLEDGNKAMDFRELFDKVAELKGFKEEEKDERLSQFYTDLNIDGRFMTKGSNLWGLKKWYPVEEIDEDITQTPKKKKKKKVTKKKAKIEETELDEDLSEDDSNIGDVDLEDFQEEEDFDIEDTLEDDDFDFDEDDEIEDEIDDLEDDDFDEDEEK
ncbi:MULTISPECIES: DNA-directed RNA polymerase subunit delta [Gracilibacillus]|uniref:Probable DNA-directed RNA polymerase subunit delta n=1 Tax=Gracilibacillus dipsosauri TaxID=178340 RepID=A0A317KTZ4_9BACI|nr:DNA-directed RNA polymerase subunit delta [Gracilibacillus dipsosauri]PWU67011.1 DNA-directed RNA polymerase subunit delta [Gracilibacillus dipsosauri]